MEIPSEQEIISFCATATSDRVISTVGTGVLRMTERLVVKYGYSVTIEEANNQRFASEVLDPRIVGVPRVYHFFNSRGMGYLVMEFVSGKVIAASNLNDQHYEKITETLSHFQTISAEKPGNLDGRGVSYYCPFPDEGIICANLEEMESWFNSRLFKHQGYSVTFKGKENKFVLCHRDFFDRNMLWKEDGSLYLLDWLTAGFYPISFEICPLRLGRDAYFSQRVEEIINKISTLNLDQVEAVQQVWSNCQRYSFKNPNLLIDYSSSNTGNNPIEVQQETASLEVVSAWHRNPS